MYGTLSSNVISGDSNFKGLRRPRREEADDDDNEEGHAAATGPMSHIIYVLLASSAILLVSFGIFYNTRASSTSLSTSSSSLEQESNRNEKQQPHIIFILADDMGWNSLGYASQEYNETSDVSFAAPFLASMASQGILMSSYYGQEMCTPSRASLLTGRYPLSLGMQFFEVEEKVAWGMDLNETTIAEVLGDAGYSTHMLGKWHLGHYSASHLPTARGFDSYTGYLTSGNYYWSKLNTVYPEFTDFLSSNTDCYWPYKNHDMHNYSTHLYRDKAIEGIEEHDTSSGSPLFMYLAFQAVHDPFSDYETYANGIPMGYVSDETFAKVNSSLVGLKRQQYAMSLSMLDEAVESIHDALQSKGMLDNTYIIFASDNGGCFQAGGKNGPLRGSKGTLYEGGTRVDAFIYSPGLIPASHQGSIYTGMMHVSDWFPTIVALSGSDYTPNPDRPLDGHNQLPAWLGEEENPRDYLLYNWYTQVSKESFDMWVNGSFAVRNFQFKLMHAFNSTIYGDWYTGDFLLYDDDNLEGSEMCTPQKDAKYGNFEYFLFDLANDPYEQTNLYDSQEEIHVAAKKELYKVLLAFEANGAEITNDMTDSLKSVEEWKKHDYTIVPWTNHSTSGAPVDCFESS